MTADADVFRSDALANMTAHLAGPLAAGARHSTLALDASGRGSIATDTRHPMLLVVLTADLGAAARIVDLTIGADAPVRLTFAPYSERGAALAVPLAAAAPPIDFEISTPAGLEVRLVDGVLGRLLYTLGAEKARLRRAAREIAAGRRLAVARGESLDRLGVELRVPRFRAQLAWSAADGEMVATHGDEPDAPYRHRLALYRPQVRPTRPELEAALPELLARVGYRGDLVVREPDTELAVAIRVVSPPDDARRLAHLDYVRRQFLLPLDASELPAGRLVSVAERTRTRELLARLRTSATWPLGTHVAPAIAQALDRVARCARLLGVTTPIAVTQAQNDGGGSRYELGVGVDVNGLAAATVEQLVERLREGDFDPSADPRAALLLSEMTPVAVDDDPHAGWLWRGCGLRTVHSLGGSELFLSHLPMHGARLDVATTASALDLSAVLHVGGDAATDANLGSALVTAIDDPSQWMVSPASTVAGATVPPAPALALFASNGLATPAEAPAIAETVAAVAALPAELFVVLRADATISAGILAGTPAGGTPLAAVITRLQAAGVVSVLPLVAGGTVLLVVGMIDLPAQAAVFNRRRSQFRWLAAPLEADDRIGTLEKPQGARNRYLFAGAGNASQVAAIIAMTPTRPLPIALHRRVEPYTIAVDLADDDQPLLSFAQYEYLMNLLDRWCPLGVTVDTSRLRARGVDFDGDGVADLMSLRLQHTFRPFRGRRPLGARS